MNTKLVIADDHEMVRRGIRVMLEGSDIEIVGEADSADQLMVLLATSQPDVIMLDVRLPGRDGLTILSQLREQFGNLPVVMYSAYDNPAYEARALTLGAHGYLLKTASREEIFSALRAAAAGHRVWTRGDLRRLSGFTATAEPSLGGDTPLTPREGEVLQALSTGKTNKEISESLGISTETVKEHVQHILRKLGVADRTQAAVWAVRQGLV